MIRHYNPETGRFLSEDPIGFFGGDNNFYRYVFNSPLIYRDPNGEFGLIGAIIGGIAGGIISGITSGGDSVSIGVGIVSGAIGGAIGPGGIAAGLLFGIAYDFFTNPSNTDSKADLPPKNQHPVPAPSKCNPTFQSCPPVSPNMCIGK